MTITARYPGKCSKCGRSITVGEKIEWSRGSKAYHSKCPMESAKAAAMQPTKKSSGPRLASSKQKAVIRRASQDWFDIFDGASGYDIHRGPTDAELDKMTSKEASGLIDCIMSDRW